MGVFGGGDEGGMAYWGRTLLNLYFCICTPPPKKIIEVAFEFEVIQFCISIEENVT